MQGDKEFYGTLRGFDEFWNLIIDDVKEYSYAGSGGKRFLVSKLDSILLNGSHICMLISGDDPIPLGDNETE
jgi:U6 snRNA-associated Sm-like protein LSm5